MYKGIIYILCVLASVFAFSGINFNNFFKKDKIWEARIFIILISLALGYLTGNFLIEFLNTSKIF